MSDLQPLIVVGIGGFGRETLDVVEALERTEPHPRFRLRGAVDDAPSALNLQRLAERGVSYLGTAEDWLRSAQPCVYLIGVGSPKVRAAIADRWDHAGHRAATAVHPTAAIGSRTLLAPGTIVCAGAQVSTNVQLGRHTHVNPNATIGHDSVLQSFVSVNPGAVVSGEVELGEGCLIGAGAVVLQGLRVGREATVGAAACVVADVAAGATVKGVPAR